MKITILGPQGSGKSTQANLLASKLNVPVVDIGEIIRNSCKVETPENKEACALMKQGELVPDEYAGNLLKEFLSQPYCENGFVLDGYPRTTHQLKVFDPKVEQVFFISTTEETSIKRAMERGRLDDTKDAIERRLAWYQEKTSKVLDYYEKMGILTKVDGERDRMEVFNQISENL